MAANSEAPPNSGTGGHCGVRPWRSEAPHVGWRARRGAEGPKDSVRCLLARQPLGQDHEALALVDVVAAEREGRVEKSSVLRDNMDRPVERAESVAGKRFADRRRRRSAHNCRTAPVSLHPEDKNCCNPLLRMVPICDVSAIDR
jgi:hypothetical protein